MVEAVPGCLHLLPAHIRHMEGSPGGTHRLAGLQVIRGGLRPLHRLLGRTKQLRLILSARLLRKGQHLIRMGLVRVLQCRFDYSRIKVKKFLIPGGVLELLDLRRQVVLLGLSQGGQLLI